jgi:uncharacterized integral membrane protein
MTDPADPRAPRPPAAPYPPPGQPPPTAQHAHGIPGPPVGGGSDAQGAWSTPGPAAAPTGPAAGFDRSGHVRRSRVSGVWVGLIAVAVFLILLVIFIAQNLTRVSIHFLGFSGHLSLGLLVLIAAIAGLAIAAVPGSLRILQLRRALKRNTPPSQRAGT